MLNSLIDFIYPRRCPVCGGIVVPKPDKVCRDCYLLLPVISEPRCKKCSKPIEDEEQEYCLDCLNKKHHYEEGLALWIYDKVMQKSVADFKFHYKREYADFYVEQLIDHFGDNLKRWDIDCFIPIPLHVTKQLERGFNQAGLIALGLGKVLGIPVLSKSLRRKKATRPQKELNDRERYKNLSDAFSFKLEKGYVEEQIKNIVLVDDIYTTGSTIEMCTKILLEHGIDRVYFISLCIGKGY